MILKGQPGRVVHKRMRKHGMGRGTKHRIVPLFKFDENGLAEIDESKLTDTDIKRLKHLFEEVNTVSLHKPDGVINYREMGYQDLKKLCKERGIKAGRVNKDDLIDLLEVHDGISK